MINSLQRQFPRWCELTDCAHRWRELVACAQFKIHNSLPVLPVPFVPPVSQFKIQNSKCATPFGKLSEFVKVFSVNLFQDMTFLSFCSPLHIASP